MVDAKPLTVPVYFPTHPVEVFHELVLGVGGLVDAGGEDVIVVDEGAPELVSERAHHLVDASAQRRRRRSYVLVALEVHLRRLQPGLQSSDAAHHRRKEQFRICFCRIV